ncbi:MAG TPA: pilus assembly protein TadG-related protein [Rhodocyclaceae bacterium]|nr:pilus assembly protein TadG-related protein [Rhodocyclaceae bacterium]
MVFSLFAALLMILGLYAMYGMNSQVVEKIRLQNTADAAAYSAAIIEARDYNFSAYTNRAMVANQVAVAQFVGLTSWMRNMAAFAANQPTGGSTSAGREYYQIVMEFGDSPVQEFYMDALQTIGNGLKVFNDGSAGSDIMKALVTALDVLINVYGEMQTIYHGATALSVAQTVGAPDSLGQTMSNLTGVDWFSALGSFLNGTSILSLNDPNASLSPGSLAYLFYHYYQWYNFTEGKDPNTANGDGTEADRFANVTMASLDDFSRDRSTKPAWGFTFFYAPPLTYIDPTRIIPYQDGPLFYPVIHRGGTELKLTTSTGGNTAGGTATSPTDCHGNPTGGATSAINVKLYTNLSAYNATSCPGDPASVQTDDGAGHPAGPYAFDGTNWLNPQDPGFPPNKKPAPTATGSGNSGAADMKSKKTWTAMDASSFSGLSFTWISILGIPIPLPIPFAPPWTPLSNGGAQSGTQLSSPVVFATNNNFGDTSSESYGSALSSWLTAIPAGDRQSAGAGNTLDAIPSLGGLRGYRDVSDVSGDNLTAPALVIEVQKPVNTMAKPPGVGRLALQNGAPTESSVLSTGTTQYVRALSKSQVYFSRPNGDAALSWFDRDDKKTELGSLYNPYWQAQLMPNSFFEQYLSVELHSLGI